MAVPPPPEGWSERLLDQLHFHWTLQIRPGLDGLTDDEYFWEPTADVWSIVPRGRERTEYAGGTGAWVMEAAYPDPDPAPVTTIAWRIAHITVQVLGERNANHFSGPPMNFFEYDYAGSAAAALAGLDDSVARWSDGLRSLDDVALETAVGPAEGPFAEHPYAGLILHVNREVIHHSAEILLLRELYARAPQHSSP